MKEKEEIQKKQHQIDKLEEEQVKNERHAKTVEAKQKQLHQNV